MSAIAPVPAASTRRHQLSPTKPSKSTRSFGTILRSNTNVNVNRNNVPARAPPPSPPPPPAGKVATATYPTATKRSYCDENGDVSPAPVPKKTSSSHKRVKSGLSSKLNAVLKSAISSYPSTGATAPQGKSKRSSGTLIDVTNTRTSINAPRRGSPPPSKHSLSKSGFVKPAGRTVLKPLSPKKASPIAAKQLSPLRRAGARGRSPSPRFGSKRAYSPPTFRRIDPPSFSPRAISSIDSLLASASRLQCKPLAAPAANVARSKDDLSSPLITANIPDSWVFDIYEDSPEETLQNLMEHSTCTLYISDDSDDESTTSELHEKGKENIAPGRLAELLAVSPPERANAMCVDAAEKTIPQRRAAGGGPGGRVLREHREVLREVQHDELVVLPEPVTCAAENKKQADDSSNNSNDIVKLPTLADENFFTFSTPKKQLDDPDGEDAAATPHSPGSPGFIVWESDHEGDTEDNEGDEIDIATGVPLPSGPDYDLNLDLDLERELAGQEFEIFGSDDAASLSGMSDAEN